MVSTPRIAAIVPCYNEEAAVRKVVCDLKQAVPEATIYVYDNNSTDRTVAVAAEAGAVVRTERRRGKGNVVRRAFADIDADIYILIDGDDTYDAAAAPAMIAALQDGPLDHVLGVRQQTTARSAYRPGHEAGNQMFNRLVGFLFGEAVTDMLSGYRVLSRRFVKSFPALSREFEIETELTVHTMRLRVPQTEVRVGFRDRPDASVSKLRTYHDGFRILRLVAQLLQHERPVVFYGLGAAFFMILGLILGIPLIVEFAETGLVPRLPTALLASSLILIAILSFVVGLILNGVLRVRAEAARLEYLRWPAVAGQGFDQMADATRSGRRSARRSPPHSSGSRAR
jgi:glycosyltransferase involved in cell wall biosynthesis